RMNQLYARSSELKTLAFDCQACKAKFCGTGILLHFIGMRHQAKVTELGASVSPAALEYWMDQLQPESVATATVAASTGSFWQANAATAAPPHVGDEQNEVIVLDD
ncbi:hypothetical protein PENTCL1PPCAC_24236, partial [Pristionchus entomophagus]